MFRPADFNSDDRADMYVISSGAPGSVQVFDAASRFTTMQSWPLQLPAVPAGMVRTIDVGDYNGDSRGDIFAIDSQTGSSTVRIRVYNAASQFQALATDVTINLPSPLVSGSTLFVGEYDGESAADLYVTRMDDAGTLSVQVRDGSSRYLTALLNQTIPNTGANASWQVLTTSYGQQEPRTEGGPDPSDTEPASDELEPIVLPDGAVEIRAFSSGGGTPQRPGVLAAAADTGSDTIPSSGWSACGNFDGRSHLVRRYSRLMLGFRMVGDSIAFRCGQTNDSSGVTRYGFRHVEQRHRNDWQSIANYIGRQWQDVAGWAMDFTASDPDSVTISGTYRHCQDREFGLYVYDELVKKFRAILYLGETGIRVMTFYPTTKSTKCIKNDTPFNNILFTEAPKVY